MDDQMRTLLEKLKDHMDMQTITITNAVTKNIMEVMDEKLKPLQEENKNLKAEIQKLQGKINSLEIDKKRNNIIVFGMNESTQSTPIDSVRSILQEKLNLTLEKHEIIKAHRLGPKNEKPRPILVSLTTSWRKKEIMKYKNKLPKGIYLSEDFSKETLAKRKELMPKLQEARKNGQIAFLKGDKLIVKESQDQARDNRKRMASSSPPATTSETTSKVAMKKVNRINAFDRLYRERSQSLTEISKK